MFLIILQGARRKILSSVQKLKERPALLRSINEELEKAGDHISLLSSSI
jgi:hypothetical protein